MLLGLGLLVPIALLARELPSSVCSDGKVRYFAFGSNLLRSKMEGRGDTEILECSPAVVADHRLAFNMRMFPPLEPSMASIEPSSGDVCEGALYTLTRDGYESLWKSEGGMMDRPGYEEIVVRARVGGEVVDAITLRAAPWMRLSHDAPPSARYKKLIVDGATELGGQRSNARGCASLYRTLSLTAHPVRMNATGLSSEYVATLQRLPASSPSKALTAIVQAHGVVAVLLFRLSQRLNAPALRGVLIPVRSACYLLLRGRSSDTARGVGRALLDAASELAIGALLLPTAALGALLRSVLRLLGKGALVQFGPPPSVKRDAAEAPPSGQGSAMEKGKALATS